MVLREGWPSVVEDDAQQGAIDLKAAVVLDEAHFLELIHEEIYAGARCADRICQRFLRNLWKDRLRLVVLTVTSKQQKSASQSLLR